MDETERRELLNSAIHTLSEQFLKLHWSHYDITVNGRTEKVQRWLGEPNEEVMVCVLKKDDISEQFHRQDYFFMIFAYKGSYDAVSYRHDNKIAVNEGDCYIGQPFTGYAIHTHRPDEQILIGVLIQRQTFYRSFLPLISGDAELMRFFVESRANEFADEFILLNVAHNAVITSLLECMTVEYANKSDDTQNILKPLALSMLMYLAREFRAKKAIAADESLSAQMMRFMQGRMDAVSLADIAAHFGYHPSYVSALLHKETGRTFSQILLGLRMERAAMLMQGTTLTLDEIAAMLGYGDASNFYKAFKAFYGVSPRKFAGEAQGK